MYKLKTTGPTLKLFSPLECFLGSENQSVKILKCEAAYEKLVGTL